MDSICVTICVNDNINCLSVFLKCISSQTYPQNQTILYFIGKNSKYINEWINDIKYCYKNIYVDNQPDIHLAIQNSVKKAKSFNAHYHYIECDTYIIPSTIYDLYNANTSIIAPLLVDSSLTQSNFDINTAINPVLIKGEIRGIIQVSSISKTFFINHNMFITNSQFIKPTLHNNENIILNIDNRKNYGFFCKSDNIVDYIKNLNMMVKLFNVYKTTEKALIIVPSAGFGNRIRAIASAILAAEKLNRKLYICWNSMEPFCYRPHIRDLQKAGWSNLFEDTIPQANIFNFPVIDKYYSEWTPGDYWFTFQNVTQRLWGILPENGRIGNDASFLKNCTDNVIVIETSLDFYVDTPESTENYKNIYAKYFLPNKYYSELLNSISNYDIGINIRKGDITLYFPDSIQNSDCIKEWIINTSQTRKVAIFSDDYKYTDELRTLINSHLNIDYTDKSDLEITFLHFLIMAHKCNIICGTPCSSFAEQAAIFGGKPYFHNLTKID